MNIFQETTFNHSVAGETSPDIEYSDDLAENEIEIEETEVVKKKKGGTETPGTEIAVAGTENEYRIDVPIEDVEKSGTDSKTPGREKI